MGPLGFHYVGPDGRRIRDTTVLARIRALVIPPAWTEVWICCDARGHIQAAGRDARRRRQYRYHPQWRAWRDRTKFDRMQAFAAALPRIRARVAADLSRPGLPREKVLAAVVQLLERSLIRVGNDEYARHNRSFGLTTLRDSHVKLRGAQMRFEFRGKSGIRHSVDIADARLARIVRQCRDLPGQELFQYIDGNGARQDVTSADVNAYIKQIAGDDFTAKDFRTWAGTVLACTALRSIGAADSQAKAKKNVVAAIDAVAGVLRNTRAVCRNSYIHPAVIECYTCGRLSDYVKHGAIRKAAGLRADEAVALAVLAQGRVRPKAAARRAA